jgi:hypothetical protein
MQQAETVQRKSVQQSVRFSVYCRRQEAGTSAVCRDQNGKIRDATSKGKQRGGLSDCKSPLLLRFRGAELLVQSTLQSYWKALK